MKRRILSLVFAVVILTAALPQTALQPKRHISHRFGPIRDSLRMWIRRIGTTKTLRTV